MEITEEMLEQARKEAWQEGFDAALEKVRAVARMKEMGMGDCEIVRRSGLPPAVVHGLMGE